MRRRAILVSALFAACFALAGCGGGKIVVEGKVVNGSKPYSADTDGTVNIVLTQDGKNAASGKADADGSFKIGSDSGGVPSGKYTVQVTVYPANPEAKTKSGPPMPSNKQLPETWDVSSSKKSFTLDLTQLQSIENKQ